MFWRDLIAEIKQYQKSLISSEDMIGPWLDRIGTTRDEALSNAAIFFGLDPRDQVHMAGMLRILADVVFRPTKKGRRRGNKKWHRSRLFQLGMHLQIVMEKEHGKISDGAAARKIKERFKRDYQHDSLETLRQRLLPARREFERTVTAYRKFLEEKKTSARPVAGLGTPMRILGL